MPRAAVLSDQQGDYVYTVGPGNKAQQTRVQLGQSTPDHGCSHQRADRRPGVIVEGIQRVHAGMVSRTVHPGGFTGARPRHPWPGGARAMMISAVFVDRPRLAIVIAIVITIAGLISLSRIPIAQFPDIVPPQVQVSANYPGASAAVVESSVAQPIEAQVVGVDKMLYMKSTNSNDGSYNLTVSFALGTDPTSIRSMSTTACRRRWPNCPRRCSRRG